MSFALKKYTFQKKFVDPLKLAYSSEKNIAKPDR